MFRKHQYIGENNGKYTANRTLEIIRAMYNKAIELRKWSGNNPTRGTKKFREIARDRFLQADECARFFDAVNADKSEIVRDYIMLALFTGQRRSNLLQMRWDEISIPRAEWRIPRTKNGEPLTVHLSPQALDIIKRRRLAAEADAEWVLTPDDTIGLHEAFVEKLLAWFEQNLSGARVVITHHAPAMNPHTKYGSSPLMPAFNSLDMVPIIEKYQPHLWIYGHTHECDNQCIGRTQIISNQLGYGTPQLRVLAEALQQTGFAK